MADPEPLWADIRQQVGRLGADLREMLNLRWQLALLELRADLESTRRVAIALSLAAVVALTALPLLAAAGAEALNQCLGVSRGGWLLIFGVTLLCGAFLSGWLAWRRFRSRLVGLQETLEELHEDLTWLRQLTGREEEDARE